MRNDLPRPGDVLAGKYRVRSVLGRGRGMLYEGEHTAFEQRVAIRVVSPQIADDVEVSKFRREARALAKLGSEHVARILDVGVLPDGSFYLVRQYLEGQDLSSYLKQRRQLPIDEAIGWILQATEAVAETHAYGILLRELSPDQLFLAERSPGVRGGPRVLKIIDFGTAKLLRESQPGAVEDYTATTVMGLSPYSSPEMVRRQRDIDARTDVWSLGAILYEMLAGQPPFGSDALSLAISITRDEPVPLTRYRRDVPVELETAIRCTLMKDRSSRLADTHAFAAALARFAPPEGRVLMERIRDLASSARARLGGESDDEMEISDVEEVDEETGDGDDVATRVGHVSEIGGAPRTSAFPARGGPVLAGAAAPQQQSPAKTAPVPRRSVTQEKTEALGFNFVPSDPMLLGLGKDSVPPPRADNAPKPTQLLPVVQGPAPTFGPPKTTPPPPPAPPAPPSAPTSPYERGSHAPSSSPMGASPMGPSPMGASPMGPSPMGPSPMAPPALGSAPGDAQAMMARSARDVPAWMHTAGPQGAAGLAPSNNARTRKIAMFAIGGGLVALLAMVVFIIVLPTGGSSSQPGASATSEPTTAATSTAATSTAATSTAGTATTNTADPVATSTATSEPVAKSDPVATAEPKSTGAAATAKPKATSAATAATPTATTKPTATVVPTSEPPKSGDQGTLVLVATGGTCAFSVNGQAKGTTNSMKLSVPAGSYAVTCKPASGSSKSKSVQVKSGGTAMAMFKL